MKRIFNRLLLLLIATALVACGGEAEHGHGVEEAANVTYTCPMHPQIVQKGPGSCPICGMDLVPVQKQTAESSEASLMLSDTQIKLGNIQVQPVQGGQVGSSTVLNGRLVVDQTQADVISSRADGRIEKLYVKETGQFIREGQPLYDLYSESLLTLEQEYLLALDQVQAFPKEQQFASILEAAKQKLLLMGLSKGQITRIARSRKLDARITFLAQAAGTVTEIASAEGMYVAEGALLYRINRLNTIWVEAELYASEASQVQIGTPVEVRVPGVQEAIKTKISFINPEFRQNSQIVVARAALSNPQGRLIPGTQASIALPSASDSQKAMVLPLDAVVRDAQGAHVWVKTAENTFTSRMVTLGEESANQVAIENGLKPNDTVVVTGAYLLYSEYVLKKGTSPMAGHNH
ncbi:efflux RND transporter periplasmic adaptor subunit [Rufibacter roseus]|uniref:Efflux RND transporter periplasmic adaptor subunit n=1 Tax=Rufibacter roseus TaxID=1567108 RepID=A0ABW2DL85_9BACT|nr:efflux RND transporter periplasmic adaptor subunit [Rufibacter roseus]